VAQWGEMIHSGIAGWIARERDGDRRWVAAPDHTWEGVGEIEVDPTDDNCLWAKRGSGILLSSRDGKTADLFSRAELGSCELYLEFCIPVESTSGVYLLGQYEVQIVDSYGLSDDELDYASCGGICARWVAETRTSYDGHPPRTNAALPAGEWQTLEIEFHAPRFDDAGRKVANARFERVRLNDVLIHEKVECSGPTRGSWSDVELPRGPLRLQGDHGPVAFRDIRMRTIFE
jgi:3-keto-disaccharide hydrolase